MLPWPEVGSGSATVISPRVEWSRDQLDEDLDEDLYRGVNS